MYLSSQEGHAHLVQLLLDAGANIEAMTHEGATPLIIASQNDKVSTVQLLLSKGAQVNHEAKDGYVNY